jgi:ferredoxin-NADP reductase
MTKGLHRVRVARVDTVASGIKRFELVGATGRPLPRFSAGSHIIVVAHQDGRIWRNPYSIMGATEDKSGYVISVHHSPESRGGSRYLHTQVRVGTELDISEPVNLFPIVRTGRKHILIAGGIGITPMLAMLEELKRGTTSFELHYAVRSPEVGAYYSELANSNDGSIRVYRSDRDEHIPLSDILSNQPLGSHLYICGPQRMIDWALEVAKKEGWPEENVHCERFNTAPAGKPFDIRLKDGRIVHVGDHQSMLEALEQAGVEAPYLCRGGACGQCVTRVISSDTALIHNDHYLTDDEKKIGLQIAICVSRIDGGCIALDL